MGDVFEFLASITRRCFQLLTGTLDVHVVTTKWTILYATSIQVYWLLVLGLSFPIYLFWKIEINGLYCKEKWLARKKVARYFMELLLGYNTGLCNVIKTLETNRNSTLGHLTWVPQPYIYLITHGVLYKFCGVLMMCIVRMTQFRSQNRLALRATSHTSQRAMTMRLWGPKRKCPKAVPTHLHNYAVRHGPSSVVWSHMRLGPQSNAISMNFYTRGSSHMIK